MFGKHAIEFYQQNYHVIPVNVKRKSPAISKEHDAEKKKWTEFDSEDFIERYPDWEASRYNMGIGLACGEINDIVALDLDAESSFFEQIGLEIPHSNIAKRGARGQTLFFRYSGEPTRHFSNIHIDLVSDFAFTVVPPSIHSSGVRYEWLGPSITMTKAEYLNVLPEGFIEKLEQLDKKYATKKNKTTGRNNKLFEIASAIAEKVNLGQKTLTDGVYELLEYDHIHHTPPWFSDPEESHRKTPQELASAMIERSLDKEEKVTVKPKPIEPSGEPEPTHFLKELRDYILMVSPKARPKFALASAISTLVPLLCHRYTFKNTAPNLYQVLIAKSGGGKNEPLSAPMNIFAHAGAMDYMGQRSYRSSAVTICDLDRQPIRIDSIDEIDMLFGSMNNTKGFNSETSGLLAELYTSSTKLFLGKTTQTDGTKGACHSPCVSILGATTMDGIENSLTEDNITRGLGGRFLYVLDKSKIDKEKYMNFDPNRPEVKKKLAFICEAIRKLYCNRPSYETATPLGEAFYKFVREGRKIEKKNIEVKRPFTKDIACSPEAEGLYREIKSEFFDKQENPMLGGVESALCARALEFVHKIALTSWASRGAQGLVEKADLQFAKLYVDSRIKDALKCASEHVAVSVDDKVVNKIREFRGKTLAHTDLYKQFYRLKGMTKTRFNSIIDSLSAEGELTTFTRRNASNGKMTTFYSIV